MAPRLEVFRVAWYRRGMPASHIEPPKELDAAAIRSLFQQMGEAMARSREWAEIAVFGGAAMVLHFGDRPATRDVDYLPGEGTSNRLTVLADEIGSRNGLPAGWFNDAVRFFVEHVRDDHPFEIYPPYATDGGLRVMLASPRYLLAMKIRAMRSSLEAHDISDVWDLLGHCGIDDADECEALVDKFFPGIALPTRNRAVLRDLVEARASGKSYDPMVGW